MPWGRVSVGRCRQREQTIVRNLRGASRAQVSAISSGTTFVTVFLKPSTDAVFGRSPLVQPVACCAAAQACEDGGRGGAAGPAGRRYRHGGAEMGRPGVAQPHPLCARLARQCCEFCGRRAHTRVGAPRLRPGAGPGQCRHPNVLCSRGAPNASTDRPPPGGPSWPVRHGDVVCWLPRNSQRA